MTLRVAAFALAASSTFGQTFFPPGALPDTSAIRYTQFLLALKEPSLFELASRDPNADPSTQESRGEQDFDCIADLLPPLRLARIRGYGQ